MEDAKQQLLDLVSRRDAVKADKQRIQGKLESARTELDEVDADLRARKVDPKKIDTVIKQLGERLGAEVTAIEDKIVEAETKVTPFLEGPE
jgi:chromosome segregation ATPase